SVHARDLVIPDEIRPREPKPSGERTGPHDPREDASRPPLVRLQPTRESDRQPGGREAHRTEEPQPNRCVAHYVIAARARAVMTLPRTKRQHRDQCRGTRETQRHRSPNENSPTR